MTICALSRSYLDTSVWTVSAYISDSIAWIIVVTTARHRFYFWTANEEAGLSQKQDSRLGLGANLLSYRFTVLCGQNWKGSYFRNFHHNMLRQAGELILAFQ